MLHIDLHPFPELKTDRLFLRPLTQQDVREFYVLRSDEQVMKYIDLPRLPSQEAAAALIQKITDLQEKNESLTWAICLKNEAKMIGSILYKNISAQHHRAEVGYMLLPEYWSKGIISEALGAVLDFGFNSLHFHSIEALVNPENTGSIRMLEKHHFVREGYYRENYFFEGKFLDTGVYSLLQSDYQKARGY